MAKKKKAIKLQAKEKKPFNHNPFSDLKGFAVDTAAEKKLPQSDCPEEKSTPKVYGSFAEEMELIGVKPLNAAGEDSAEGKVGPQPPVPEPEKTVAPQSEEQLFRQAVGDLPVSFNDQLPEDEVPVAASARRMKQLKQGKLTPEASLDLHGLQRAEVAGKLGFFLQDAAYHGWRTVLVITGKGLHSDNNEPQLRIEAERFLAAAGRKWVAEWGQAPRKYGGAGALVLFLRKK